MSSPTPAAAQAAAEEIAEALYDSDFIGLTPYGAERQARFKAQLASFIRGQLARHFARLRPEPCGACQSLADALARCVQQLSSMQGVHRSTVGYIETGAVIRHARQALAAHAALAADQPKPA